VQRLAFVVAAVFALGFAPCVAHAERGMGQLVVNAQTLGAEVFVDGVSAGLTPLSTPLTLTAEEHTLKVQKLGYAPLIDVIKIQRHKQTKIDVDLPPVSGILRVRSTIKEARVFVDGKFAGEAPLETEMPVGARAIQVSKAGFKDFFKNVDAVAGQEIAIEVVLEELPADINPYKPKPPPPPKWYEKWWVWTVGVVGVGAVVTAVVVPVVLVNKDPVKDFSPSYQFSVGKNPAP
jgi:hypothetical protein